MPGVGTELSGIPYVEPILRDANIDRGFDYIPRGLRNVIGGAFGWGTAFKIKQAYAFLSHHYNLGDHVYLFGFSRGAFAARSLAGFVEQVGILYRDNLDQVEAAYALYESPDKAARSKLAEKVREMVGRSGPFVEATRPYRSI